MKKASIITITAVTIWVVAIGVTVGTHQAPAKSVAPAPYAGTGSGVLKNGTLLSLPEGKEYSKPSQVITIDPVHYPGVWYNPQQTVDGKTIQ